MELSLLKIYKISPPPSTLTPHPHPHPPQPLPPTPLNLYPPPPNLDKTKKFWYLLLRIFWPPFPKIY